MLSDEVKKNLLKTGKACQLIPIKTNDEEKKFTGQLIIKRMNCFL